MNLYTAVDFYKLEQAQGETDEQWRIRIKCHLYSHGSLLCDVPIPIAYESQLTMMSANVFNPEELPVDDIPQRMAGKHSMVIMGWDDAKGVWIVRNSWSTEWPNNGYIYWKYGAGYIEKERLVGCNIPLDPTTTPNPRLRAG
jgi:hypothetical protein